MAQVETNVVALELERVLPKIAIAYEWDDKFFANIEKKNVEKISSRQMRVPIELRPGGSFQYFDPAGGDLGRGGGPTYDKAVLTSVFLSLALEYTKQTQWSTDDERKAVVNSVRRLTANALKEFRRQLDAQAMGDGTGVVGTITAVSTSGGVDTYTLSSTFGARLVRYGQDVQVYDTTLATFRGIGTITKWDVANNQIQVTPAIASSQNTDVLVVKGLVAPATAPALYGVMYQHSNASTGTWLGFNRAITPEVLSNRVNAASAALSLPLPRLAINLIGNRVGIDNDFAPDAWMHPCQKQAYEQIGQLVSLIWKQPKDESLNMYFGDNMQMAGAPVKTSFNWSKIRIDFVNKEVWGRGEILPIGFYTTDGRKIFELRGPSGGVATADIFYMVTGFQFFVSTPAATAYIDNLAIPAGY